MPPFHRTVRSEFRPTFSWCDYFEAHQIMWRTKVNGRYRLLLYGAKFLYGTAKVSINYDRNSKEHKCTFRPLSTTYSINLVQSSWKREPSSRRLSQVKYNNIYLCWQSHIHRNLFHFMAWKNDLIMTKIILSKQISLQKRGTEFALHYLTLFLLPNPLWRNNFLYALTLLLGTWITVRSGNPRKAFFPRLRAVSFADLISSFFKALQP